MELTDVRGDGQQQVVSGEGAEVVLGRAGFIGGAVELLIKFPGAVDNVPLGNSQQDFHRGRAVACDAGDEHADQVKIVRVCAARHLREDGQNATEECLAVFALTDDQVAESVEGRVMRPVGVIASQNLRPFLGLCGPRGGTSGPVGEGVYEGCLLDGDRVAIGFEGQCGTSAPRSSYSGIKVFNHKGKLINAPAWIIAIRFNIHLTKFR